MKQLFIFTLLSTIALSSGARVTETVVCLIKDQSTSVEIINGTSIGDATLFDDKTATYTDLENLKILQNDDKFIKLEGQMAGQYFSISYDRETVRPLKSQVKIGEKAQACECYYGEINLDDKYYN